MLTEGLADKAGHYLSPTQADQVSQQTHAVPDPAADTYLRAR